MLEQSAKEDLLLEAESIAVLIKPLLIYIDLVLDKHGVEQVEEYLNKMQSSFSSREGVGFLFGDEGLNKIKKEGIELKTFAAIVDLMKARKQQQEVTVELQEKTNNWNSLKKVMGF